MLKVIYKFFDKKFGKIPASIVNFATVFPFVISIISGILWVISFFLNFDENFGKYISALLNFCSDIRFMLFSFMLVLLINEHKKFYSECRLEIKRNNEFSRNYYEFLHNFRNKMGEFQVLRKNEPDNLKSVQLLVRELLKSILDNLCDTYSIYSRETISGCVKMIVPNNEEITIDNAYVQTLERSSHSNPARRIADESGELQMVRNNTNFYEILMDSKKSVFYQSDLKDFANRMKKAGREYKNTNTEWEKYYISTIVAPIRIANRRSPYNEKEIDYAILGFLCVDSMSTNAFPADKQECYTNIIKAYAALLYVILEQYKVYLQYYNDFSSDKKSSKARRTLHKKGKGKEI